MQEGQLEFTAHDRQRRSQLMARIIDEGALSTKRVVETSQHVVERAGEVGEFCRHGHAPLAGLGRAEDALAEVGC